MLQFTIYILQPKEIQMQAIDSADKQKQQECSICFTLSQKPVQCRGPCHKLFCLKCAAEAKCLSDRCPNRCSAPFEVQLLPAARLLCPFKPQQCKIFISTQQQLSEHYKTCPLISPEQREQNDYKINYKCKKGHELTFLPKSALQIMYGSLAFLIKDKCTQCGQIQINRTICISCSIKENLSLYCSDCRTPPCSKQKCPLGHKLKHRNKPGKLRYCDFCDVPAGLLGRRAHGFCPCDFDLCDLCYQKLPQNDARIPLRYNQQKIWPLALINDQDSQDSDWQE